MDKISNKKKMHLRVVGTQKKPNPENAVVQVVQNLTEMATLLAEENKPLKLQIIGLGRVPLTGEHLSS